MKPLLVIDAANVIGSVPNGWWHDRKGAVERLRDRLAGYGNGSVELLLVVEGKAREVQPIPGVPVKPAPGSGDDTIVDVVRSAVASRPVTVVTADRELRSRVTEVGASVVGPRSLWGGELS